MSFDAFKVNILCERGSDEKKYGNFCLTCKKKSDFVHYYVFETKTDSNTCINNSLSDHSNKMK